MLNLDENLKKIIILMVDGIGNRMVSISDIKKGGRYDELKLKKNVERYLSLLMKVKNSMVIDLLKEVEQ